MDAGSAWGTLRLGTSRANPAHRAVDYVVIRETLDWRVALRGFRVTPCQLRHTNLRKTKPTTTQGVEDWARLEDVIPTQWGSSQ